MEMEDALDIMLGVVIIALFIVSMTPKVVKMQTKDYGGFGTQIEKTALKTDKTLQPLTYKLHKEDILLMMAITDEYEPLPRKFSIDGVPNTIVVDSAFLQNRIRQLIEVNQGINGGESEYLITTQPGINTNQAESWKFSRVN